MGRRRGKCASKPPKQADVGDIRNFVTKDEAEQQQEQLLQRLLQQEQQLMQQQQLLQRLMQQEQQLVQQQQLLEQLRRDTVKQTDTVFLTGWFDATHRAAHYLDTIFIILRSASKLVLEAEVPLMKEFVSAIQVKVLKFLWATLKNVRKRQQQAQRGTNIDYDRITGTLMLVADAVDHKGGELVRSTLATVVKKRIKAGAGDGLWTRLDRLQRLEWHKVLQYSVADTCDQLDNALAVKPDAEWLLPEGEVDGAPEGHLAPDVLNPEALIAEFPAASGKPEKFLPWLEFIVSTAVEGNPCAHPVEQILAYLRAVIIHMKHHKHVWMALLRLMPEKERAKKEIAMRAVVYCGRILLCKLEYVESVAIAQGARNFRYLLMLFSNVALQISGSVCAQGIARASSTAVTAQLANAIWGQHLPHHTAGRICAGMSDDLADYIAWGAGLERWWYESSVAVHLLLAVFGRSELCEQARRDAQHEAQRQAQQTKASAQVKNVAMHPQLGLKVNDLSKENAVHFKDLLSNMCLNERSPLNGMGLLTDPKQAASEAANSGSRQPFGDLTGSS